MASAGHVVVGLCAARWGARGSGGMLPWAAAAGWSAWSLLPDADVVAFILRIPYEHAWGHRGATHSLLFACVMGLLLGLLWRARGQTNWRETALVGALVMASHGVLDAMTTGGLGAALGWPFTEVRFFLPWRPIPVAPIGAGFLTARGLSVAMTEVALFAPLWLWALWPRARSRV